ncbi:MULTISPECIES: 50S ribosomal protein L22 [unclassified Aureispira]|uniref:50S ribosomal protein L22 n=1 Tax=unclassified Aureispira TaxID=2649989 RepID=UPI00069845BD|nr:MULTISPECIES: 50S ribosomal protein L22 [unclassified Aureispira]WMX14821.1 50S ribosomal protein L22 [Aureispira sp. CCB-E]
MEQNQEFVTAVAKIKNCQMSARKMRLVADIIRGVEVEKALGILKYTKKEAARWLDKLLTSAIANWGVLTDEEADDYELVVSAIWVDQGSQLKRFRPAPHGRAHRIRKHFCHVTLQVTNTKTLEIKEVSEEVAYEEVEETE